MSLNWRGDKVLRNVQEAAKLGINATMAQSAEHSKGNHAWDNQTGTLEGSIKIIEYAHRSGNGYAGLWGSTDVRYALIHELGGVIVPRNASRLVFEVGGETVSASRVRIPARPYLRPAADANYPNLADNTRRAREGLIG